MSTTQLEGTTTATEASGVATVPMRFEVTTLPVADVDRAKAFYERLGWRLDGNTWQLQEITERLPGRV